VREPKIEGLDLYTYVHISVSGSSWNFQSDKSPQNRTVRFKTGHLATLSLMRLVIIIIKFYAWAGRAKKYSLQFIPDNSSPVSVNFVIFNRSVERLY